MTRHVAAARPRSGTQYHLAGFGYTATIASVGATIRELRHQGRDLIVPFPADRVRPNFRGATLAPWPNRVVDGSYHFAGTDHLLALTEPTRGHALHGLACWLEFQPTSQTESDVRLEAVIEPQMGYPFRLHLGVAYSCTPQGLITSVTATNLGTDPAPFGTGPHPYLVAGPSPLDDWTLHLPADRVMSVDPDRLIPTGIRGVDNADNGAYDFRRPRPIGATTIDHAFTGLRSDTTGRIFVTVTDPSGTGVRMTWDTRCPWVQIHTADLPAPAPSRLGLAVEPMTCPPDAFNSKTDLITLQPASTTTVTWLLEAVDNRSTAQAVG